MSKDQNGNYLAQPIPAPPDSDGNPHTIFPGGDGTGFDSGVLPGGVMQGQIVPFTGTDPNSDHVKPFTLIWPAIAVKAGAKVWVWDVVNQIWVITP